MSLNPYQSPRTEQALEFTAPGETSTAKLFTGLKTIFSAACVGGTFGLIVGGVLGATIPNYYRSVLPGGFDPSFDPFAAGIGLGLSQGAMLGGSLGLGLVTVHYFFQARTVRRRI